MAFGQSLGGKPDFLCNATMPLDIPPESMKVRQLLGWTRLSTPMDLTISPQISSPLETNVLLEDMVDLFIDEIVPSRPVNTRADNTSISREMVGLHLIRVSKVALSFIVKLHA